MKSLTLICASPLKALGGLCTTIVLVSVGALIFSMTQQLTESRSILSLLGFDCARDLRNTIGMALTPHLTALVISYVACVHMRYKPGAQKDPSWEAVAKYAALGAIATLLIHAVGVWSLKVLAQEQTAPISVSMCNGLGAELKGARLRQILDILGPPNDTRKYTDDYEAWFYRTDDRHWPTLSINIRNGIVDSVLLPPENCPR